MRTSILVSLVFGLLLVSSAYAHTFIYNLEDGTPVFRASFPNGWRLDLDFDPTAEGIDAPPPPQPDFENVESFEDIFEQMRPSSAMAPAMLLIVFVFQIISSVINLYLNLGMTRIHLSKFSQNFIEL